jgi:prepilin-type N-terminal cleavage/methylation domain-containing protein
MNRQRGFNLVELAIVLVIIGLLLGGILKGQALITSAKIKRVNNDFNGITAAIYTYLDRYGTLPGDDDKANGRWNLGDTNLNGDADGVLTGDWDSAVGDTPNETYDMWKHMHQANLVSSSEPPKNAFGGSIGVQDISGQIDYNGTPAPTAGFDINGIVICMDRLTGEVAEMVDLNFDDGVPNAGLLKAFTADATMEYTSVYNVQKDYMLCKRI